MVRRTSATKALSWRSGAQAWEEDTRSFFTLILIAGYAYETWARGINLIYFLKHQQFSRQEIRGEFLEGGADRQVRAKPGRVDHSGGRFVGYHKSVLRVSLALTLMA